MIAFVLLLGGVTQVLASQDVRMKEEVVEGYVADIRVTGKNERTFWDVPEGKDAVTLTKNKEDERLSFVCIWDGAPPARVKAGARVQVVGVYTGNTTAGARIYQKCRLKE